MFNRYYQYLVIITLLVISVVGCFAGGIINSFQFAVVADDGNLVGDFSTNTSGWSGYGSGTVSRVSANVGRYTNGSTSYSGMISDTFSVVSGTSYTFTVDISNRQGSPSFYMTGDGGSTLLSGTTLRSINADTSYDFNYTPTATTSSAQLVFYAGSITALSGCDVTDISLIEVE